MRIMRQVAGGFTFLFMALAASIAAAQGADRGKARAFLEITGFDVAIESLQQGAMAGPGLAGDAPGEFGTDWVRLAQQIFDPEDMVERALDMMQAVIPEELVDHGAAFYASELGQRLVVVENQAHMAPDEEKYAEAERVLTELVDTQSPRIALYQSMTDAIGGVESSVRSSIELQVRYLMAAMAAGAVEMDVSEQDLRGMLATQAPELRKNVQVFALLNSAYAYRDMSDADVADYVAALEDPRMQQVYEILNAIQFEIMAERYERLAAAVAELHPQQDI